jgi:hypothetical protein
MYTCLHIASFIFPVTYWKSVLSKINWNCERVSHSERNRRQVKEFLAFPHYEKELLSGTTIPNRLSIDTHHH